MPRKGFFSAISSLKKLSKMNLSHRPRGFVSSTKMYQSSIRAVTADALLYSERKNARHVERYISGYKENAKRAVGIHKAINALRLLKVTSWPLLLIKSLSVSSFYLIDLLFSPIDKLINRKHPEKATALAKALKLILGSALMPLEIITRFIASLGDIVLDLPLVFIVYGLTEGKEGLIKLKNELFPKQQEDTHRSYQRAKYGSVFTTKRSSTVTMNDTFNLNPQKKLPRHSDSFAKTQPTLAQPDIKTLGANQGLFTVPKKQVASPKQTSIAPVNP